MGKICELISAVCNIFLGDDGGEIPIEKVNLSNVNINLVEKTVSFEVEIKLK